MLYKIMPLTCFNQVCQQVFPLCSELVSACQTAITSNNTQVGDAKLYQVIRSFGAAFLGAEILTAGASNHSPTLISGTEEKY